MRAQPVVTVVASPQPSATSGKQTNTVAVVVMASLWWTNIARWGPPNFLAVITGYSPILPV